MFFDAHNAKSVSEASHTKLTTPDRRLRGSCSPLPSPSLDRGWATHLLATTARVRFTSSTTKQPPRAHFPSSTTKPPSHAPPPSFGRVGRIRYGRARERPDQARCIGCCLNPGTWQSPMNPSSLSLSLSLGELHWWCLAASVRLRRQRDGMW